MAEQDDRDAKLLRKAAERMRQHARNATTSNTGRWRVRTPPAAYPQRIADNASAILVADCFEAPEAEADIAGYIASWDPPVALAVADLLVKTAEIMEMVGTGPNTRSTAAAELARIYLRESGE